MKITEHDTSPTGGVCYEVTDHAWTILILHDPTGEWWASDYAGIVHDPIAYREAINLCKASEASFGYYGIDDHITHLTPQAAQRLVLAPGYYSSIINDERLPERMVNMQMSLHHARIDCECASEYTLHHDLSMVYTTVRELLSLPTIIRYNLLRGLGVL